MVAQRVRSCATNMLVRRRRLLRGHELDVVRFCTPRSTARRIEQALQGR
jgi:hypothetical protein